MDTLKVRSIRSIIEEFQTDILWDRIEERRRQETNEWDQVMSQIPVLPKDWERWCRRISHYAALYFLQTGKKRRRLLQQMQHESAGYFTKT